MSFELKVKTFIEKEQLLQQDDHLLIAVSGGVDSMALLHYFVQTQEHWNIRVEAVHVDHMLREKLLLKIGHLYKSIVMKMTFIYMPQRSPYQQYWHRRMEIPS